MVKVYFLVIIFFAFILIATVVHNELVDNLLIIFNFFIKYRLFPKYFTDKSGNKKTAWSAVFLLG